MKNKNLQRLQKEIKRKNLDKVKIIKHVPIRSVEDGYRVLRTVPGCTVSTIMYTDGDKYYGVFRRNDCKINVRKLKKALKVKNIRLLSSRELHEELDFEVGAVGVFHKEVEYHMDRRVLEMDRLNAGTGDKCYDIVATPEDICELTNAKLNDFTIIMKNEKKRILTGDTPSRDGRLHLGHYLGSLKNRVELQYTYETYILIANIHAYANYYDKAQQINQAAYNILLDNLAVGIDPEIATIYLESGIPETFELYSFFLTMVKHKRTLRNPTIKEELEYKKLDPSMGFVCYPILQAADILGFNADLVPVGDDQLPVIEQAREIARDFNKAYGKVFKEPKGKIGQVARLTGTDGDGKMSKSKGNCIYLSDSEAEVKEKIMGMYTDPNRIKATDPGKVEGNPVFIYHDAFNPDSDEVADLKERYRVGKVGDVEVKQKLFTAVNEFLEPIREKRAYYESRPDEVKEILVEGTKRARGIVSDVVKLLRDAVGLNSLIR